MKGYISNQRFIKLTKRVKNLKRLNRKKAKELKLARTRIEELEAIIKEKDMSTTHPLMHLCVRSRGLQK